MPRRRCMPFGGDIAGGPPGGGRRTHTGPAGPLPGLPRSESPARGRALLPDASRLRPDSERGLPGSEPGARGSKCSERGTPVTLLHTFGLLVASLYRRSIKQMCARAACGGDLPRPGVPPPLAVAGSGRPNGCQNPRKASLLMVHPASPVIN